MENSYTASLITIAAAVTTASLRYKKNQPVTGTDKKTVLSKFLKLNDQQTNKDGIVGIKFDNISARKYFVLIHQSRNFPG